MGALGVSCSLAFLLHDPSPKPAGVCNPEMLKCFSWLTITTQIMDISDGSKSFFFPSNHSKVNVKQANPLLQAINQITKEHPISGCTWTFFVEKSISFYIRREIISRSRGCARRSDHVWEQSKLAVVGKAVAELCAQTLEKERSQGQLC